MILATATKYTGAPKSGKGNIDAYSFECFSNVFDV